MMFRRLHSCEDLFDLRLSDSSFFYDCHRTKVTSLFTSHFMSLYHQARVKMGTRVELVPCQCLRQVPTKL